MVVKTIALACVPLHRGSVSAGRNIGLRIDGETVLKVVWGMANESFFSFSLKHPLIEVIET